MKAALFKRGGTFDIVDQSDPVAGPGQVVVEVAYCGICGSDLHMADAGMLPNGCVIGHEMSATVTAVGEGVDKVKEGDRVVVMPLDPCFACPQCKAGDTHMCADGMRRAYGLGARPGGFSRYMLTAPNMLFPIPDGLDMKTAALNEPWAVASHGVDMLDLSDDPAVLVLGAGPIGLLSVYALRARGVSRIYVSEPDAFRADRARKAEAMAVIDPKAQNPASVFVKEEGQSPRIVIDCAGTQKSYSDALSFLGSGGTLLMLGVHMGQVSFLPIVCFGKEASIRFSFGYTSEQFGDGLNTLARGDVDPAVVISDVMPLSKINEAFEALHQPGQTKVLIDCGV